MADDHHDGHHGPSFKLYMIIAGVLAVCTASSFVFNGLARGGSITVAVSFLAILTVAIIKAVLVGAYFMHLKWDWKMLYFLIVPSFILGAMMMVVFMPDALLGISNDLADGYEIAKQVQP